MWIEKGPWIAVGLDAWTPKGAKKPHVMDAEKLPLRVESMALPVPAQ